MGGATMGRLGKKIDQKKVVSSKTDSQISIAVQCKAAKTIAKSNNRKGEAASCQKKKDMVRTNHTVLASKWILEVVQTYGMVGHRRRWCG